MTGEVRSCWRGRWYARAFGPLVAITFGWFGLNVFHPVGPAALLWLSMPLYGPLLFLVWRDAARNPALPVANRRFWRRLAPVALLVGAGQTAQAIDVVMWPDVAGPRTGAVMLAFDGLALLLLIHALIRLPTGKQERGDVVRIILDATTVMLATAVFIWHSTAAQANVTNISILSLVLMALTSFGIFAVAKVLLSDFTVIDRAGLWLLTGAILLGALAPILQPLATAHDARLFTTQISIPLLFLLAARAGDGPRLIAAMSRPTPSVRRRPFSLMPYLAVAAVDGLLIQSHASGDTYDEAFLIGAAVTLTGLVIARQVTAMRDNARLLHELDHSATHDALTQLPNRVLFHKKLNRVLAATTDRPVAVALIDLDDFKIVNDTLGHEVGDGLLKAVADRLSSCVRPCDTVARLGGDEFVVVLEDADPATADDVISRMTEALRPPATVDGHQLPIRASIGVADGRSGDDAGNLLRLADIAMYEAKKLDGTAFLHYAPGMAAGGGDARIESEIRSAIDNDELFLLYQPIISLDDGAVIGAEALVRWAHPQHGVLAPDRFIPLAERNGLISAIDRWAIRTGLRQLAQWNITHPHAEHVGLSLNVSARHLRDPDFAARFAAQLTVNAIPADRITVEITETSALQGEHAANNLRALNRLGVGISLDDFGTGFSTLSLLHELPATEVKLDRSFTAGSLAEPHSIASTVLHIAHSMGLRAVAEGVERADQAEGLRTLGYRAAQGFYFARPMPAIQFEMLLDGPVERALPPVAEPVATG